MGDPFPRNKRGKWLTPLRITAIYLLVGGLWIIFSDSLLAVFIGDRDMLTRLQIYKGWFYVGATALLLLVLMRRHVAALRQSEERFRLMVEGSEQVYFYVHDPDHRWTYLSPSVREVLGYTPAELVGHTYDELLLGDATDQILQEQTERALRTGDRLLPYVAVVRHKDGRPVFLEVVETPIKRENRVVGLQGFARDITERMEAEEQRRAMEVRLQEMQRIESLGVLAGGIAHDFNNLLVAILGNAGLALAELPPDSRARATIEEIQVAVQHARDLTNQMLAYSGKGHFVVQPIDPNALIEETVHLLRTSLARSATLQINLHPETPPVEADATQLRQVLMNLILNASDALDGRPGLITVSTGRIHAERAYLDQAFLTSELPEGEYVFVEVADTGIGMDEETRAKIFEPFFTTKFAGRGLGLAAALGIVRGHQGALRVESAPGRGSVFRLLLPPAVSRPAPALPADPPPAAQTGQGVVLVVDDEESVRRVTARLLERIGYTVLEAANGREGLDVFRAHHAAIDCVVLDLTMPDLHGEELLHQIRLLNPHVPALLISGYSDLHPYAEPTNQEMCGFLQKPFTLNELRDEVTRVVGQK